MIRPVRSALVAILALGATAQAASAATAFANLYLATPQGRGAPVGSAIFSDSGAGAHIRLSLHGLPPGQHGFHVHDKGSCDPTVKDGAPVMAGAAGGHYDPTLSGKHMGPAGMGHVGDLPFITVAADGSDSETLDAPRIKDVSSLRGHALMIHAGGDNYADAPAPLGGGGPRVACGLIE
jgi:Cu-Zn family superoxide dismutase